MTTDSTRATRPVRVGFLDCYNATFFSAEVQMCREEEARMSRLLRWLQDAGALLLPQPREEGAESFDGIVAHLENMFGATLVGAGMAANAGRPSISGGAPVAIMPIWRLEPEGNDPEDHDVLLSSGRLWGGDVMIEALRVDGPDNPVPVREVKPRYDRWVRAGGGGCLLAAVQPPGWTGWYVLGALSAPA